MTDLTIQPDLRNLQAKLVAAIEGDEKAIELAQKRVEKNRELLQAINGSLDAFVAEVTGGSTFADTVRAAIKAVGKARFTTVEVDSAFTRHFPTVPLEKERIRNTLWNMCRRGELKVMRKGSNQAPAEYEVVMDPVDLDSERLEPRVRLDTRIRRRPEIGGVTQDLMEDHVNGTNGQ